MSLALITLDQILIILIIIVIGVVCYKIKLIDPETNNKLTNILLMLVNPLVVFISYQREFSMKLLNGLLISSLLAVFTHFFSIFITSFIFKEKKSLKMVEDEEQARNQKEVFNHTVERFSVIYTNCSFMGIPLVNGIFGSEGVFYVTAYITVWNIFLWTHGVMLMDREARKEELNLMEVIKKLASPTILAIIIGIFFFLFNIRIPSVLFKSLEYIGDLNTPFAMLIAGVTIGQANIINALKKPRMYLLVFVRLILIPLVLLLIYSRIPIDEIVVITSVIMAACPTAAMSILFSIRYNRNSIYAAEIFGITTVLSSITIPFIILIAGLL